MMPAIRKLLQGLLVATVCLGQILSPRLGMASENLAPPTSIGSEEQARKIRIAASFATAVGDLKLADTKGRREEALRRVARAVQEWFEDDSLRVRQGLVEGQFKLYNLQGERPVLVGTLIPAKPFLTLPGYNLKVAPSPRGIPDTFHAQGPSDGMDASRESVAIADFELRDGSFAGSLPVLDQRARAVMEEQYGLAAQDWEQFFRVKVLGPLAAHVDYLQKQYPGLMLFEGPRTVRLVAGDRGVTGIHDGEDVLVLRLDMFFAQRFRTALTGFHVATVDEALRAVQIADLLRKELRHAQPMQAILGQVLQHASQDMSAPAARELLLRMVEVDELQRLFVNNPKMGEMLDAAGVPRALFPLWDALKETNLLGRVHGVVALLEDPRSYPDGQGAEFTRSIEFLLAQPGYDISIRDRYRDLAGRMAVLNHPNVVGATMDNFWEESPHYDRAVLEIFSNALLVSRGKMAMYTDTDIFDAENPTKVIGPKAHPLGNLDLTAYRKLLATALRREAGPVVLLVDVKQDAKAMGKGIAWLRELGITVPVILIPYDVRTGKLEISIASRLSFLGPWAYVLDSLEGMGASRFRLYGDHLIGPDSYPMAHGANETVTTETMMALGGSQTQPLIEYLAAQPQAAEILVRQKALSYRAQKILAASPRTLVPLLNNELVSIDPRLWGMIASERKDFAAARTIFEQITNVRSLSSLWQAYWNLNPEVAIEFPKSIFSDRQVFRILQDLYEKGFRDWQEIVPAEGRTWLDRAMVERLLIKSPAMLADILSALLAHKPESGQQILVWLEPQTLRQATMEGLLRQTAQNLARREPGFAVLAVAPNGENTLLGEPILPVSGKTYILREASRLSQAGVYPLRPYLENLHKALLDPELLRWFNIAVQTHPSIVSLWLRIVVQVPWVEEFRDKRFRERLIEYGDRDTLEKFLQFVERVQAEAIAGKRFSVEGPELGSLLVQAMHMGLTPGVENTNRLFYKEGVLRTLAGRLSPDVRLESIVDTYATKPGAAEERSLWGIPRVLILAILYRFGYDPDLFLLFRDVFTKPGIHRSKKMRAVVLSYLLPDEEDSRFKRHGSNPERVPLIGVMRLAQREALAGDLSYRWQEKMPEWIQMVDFLDAMGEEYDSGKIRAFVDSLGEQPSLAEAESRARDIMVETLAQHLPGQWTDRELGRLDMSALRAVENYWRYDRQWAQAEKDAKGDAEREAFMAIRALLGQVVASALKKTPLLKQLKYGGTPQSKLQQDVTRHALIHQITARYEQAGMPRRQAERQAKEDADVYMREWVRDLDEHLDVSLLESGLQPIQVFTSDTADYWLNFGSTGGGFCMDPRQGTSGDTKALLGRMLSGVFKGKQIARFPFDTASTVFEACVPTDDGKLLLLDEVLYTAFERDNEKLRQILPATLLSAVRNAGRYGADEIMIPSDPMAKHVYLARALGEYRDRLMGLSTLVEFRDDDGNVLWVERITVTGIEDGEVRILLAPETARWKYWMAVSSRWVPDVNGEAYFQEQVNQDFPVTYDIAYPISDVPGITFDGMKLSYKGARIKIKRERIDSKVAGLLVQEEDRRMEPEVRAQINGLTEAKKLVLIGREQRPLKDLLEELRDVDKKVIELLRSEYPGFEDSRTDTATLEDAVSLYNSDRGVGEPEIFLDAMRHTIFSDTAESLSNSLGDYLANVRNAGGVSGPIHFLAVPRGGLVMAQALKKSMPDYQSLGYVKTDEDQKISDALKQEGDKTVVVTDVTIHTGKTMIAALRTLFRETKVRPADVVVVVFAADPAALLRVMRLFPDLRRVYAIDLVPRIVERGGVETVFGQIGSKIMPLSWGVWDQSVEINGRDLLLHRRVSTSKSLISYLASDAETGKRYLLKMPVAPRKGRRIVELSRLVQEGMPNPSMPRIMGYDANKRVLVSEYVEGVPLQEIAGAEGLDGREKILALIQLIRDAGATLAFLRAHNEFPVFTVENLVWDPSGQRWYLTNLGPDRYEGQTRTSYGAHISLKSLAQVWHYATQAMVGVHPSWQNTSPLMSIGPLLDSLSAGSGENVDILISRASDFLEEFARSNGAIDARPTSGMPHPAMSKATGTRRKLLEFVVKGGRASQMGDERVSNLATLDQELRAELGIDWEEEISYEVYAGEGPLGHTNTNDRIIEISEDLLGHPGAVRRVMVHELRHWIIGHEGLLDHLAEFPGLKELLGEVLAILGEVWDIWRANDWDNAIADYGVLERLAGEEQPFKAFLTVIWEGMGTDGSTGSLDEKLIETVVEFIMYDHLDFYKVSFPGWEKYDEDGFFDITDEALERWLLEPTFLTSIFARVVGFTGGETAVQRDAFTRFVGASLWSADQEDARAAMQVLKPTLRAMQREWGGPLRTARTAITLLSQDDIPDGKKARVAENLRKSLERIQVFFESLLVIKNPGLKDDPSVGAAKILDVDAMHVEMAKTPQTDVQVAAIQRLAENLFQPFMEEIADTIAARKLHKEGALKDLRSALMDLESFLETLDAYPGTSMPIRGSHNANFEWVGDRFQLSQAYYQGRARVQERLFREGDEDAIAALVHHVLVREWDVPVGRLTPVLDAFYHVESQVAWLNAMLGWKENPHRMGQTLRKLSEGDSEFQETLRRQAAEALYDYAKLSPRRTRRVFAALLSTLSGDIQIRYDADGPVGLLDQRGNRVEVLIELISSVPDEWIASTLVHFSPDQAAGAMSAYLEALLASEKLEREVLRRILSKPPGRKTLRDALDETGRVEELTRLRQEALKKTMVRSAKAQDRRWRLYEQIHRMATHHPRHAAQIAVSWLSLQNLPREDMLQISGKFPLEPPTAQDVPATKPETMAL